MDRLTALRAVELPSGISVRELEREQPPRAATDEAPPPVAVIGRGRLGETVHRELAAAGVDVAIAGREGIAEACAGRQTALLCVPDAEIGPACERVVELAPSLRWVGHPSGATLLSALSAAAAAGVGTFSMHPLQTVSDGGGSLAGAPAAIAGSSEAALGIARGLALALGMRPFELPESVRAAYHAAASIASNFLVVLEQSAVGLLDAAGVEGGRELLAPLVLRTAANWAEDGGAALTGPIARGDERTVARHVEALRELAPELLPLYEALAERTRAVAAARAEGVGA